jgi:outer membrane protein assembly factor BamB
MKMEDKSRIQLLYNAAIISGGFCLVVSLLLLLNYLQFSSKEPLESQSMEILLEKLSDDPGNEQLREDIRDLDMLARKAYFNSQWQIRTGSYLLLFGAIVFAISLRYYHSLRSRIPEPETESREVFRGGILTQRWILGTGGVLILAALAVSFITVNHLEVYGKLAASPPDVSEETIEVIDLRAEPPGNGSPGSSDAGSGQGAGSGPGSPGSGQGSPKTDADETGPGESGALESGSQSPGDGDAGFREPDPGKVTGSPGSSGRGAVLNAETINKHHNSFRGPWGNGISQHKSIPVDWDGATGKAVAWKTEIPRPGYNSPIIWEDRIYLSGADATAQVVYCYDRHSGSLLWLSETGDIPGSPAEKPQVTEDTGLAAPGLTTDGKRIFAIFATGDVVCFNTAGERLWARNLGVPDNHYGHSSSLLVWDGKLIVQYDTNRGGRILTLDAGSGDTLWDQKRSTAISWASPILVKHSGTYQVVLSADPLVAGYELNSGKELWAVECMMGEVGPSPAYGGGMIYAANEYARLVAINLDNPTAIAWEDDEYLPEVASPVVSDGLLFIATSYGVFICYDAATGEKYWEQEYGHGFYSSPVIADGRVYAIDMGGTMHIFNVSKELSLAGEPTLGEKAYATPAFAPGKIYIRGEKHLFCIEN